jgi:hypothetical protein
MLVGVPKLGVKPHPIRKRAFHRALKRGELWAVVPYEHMKNGGSCLTIGPNRFARILPDKYCPSNQAFIMWPFETGDTPE